MAFPLSRSTTYVASSTPSIKAADLNDLQDYLARIYTGVRSLKSLTVDGIGGVVKAPAAGLSSLLTLVVDGVATFNDVVNMTVGLITVGISCSGSTQTQDLDVTNSIWGTSTATPSLAGLHHIAKESAPIAVARVTAAGALVGGFNISAVARTGNGTYNVTFGTAAPNANFAVLGTANMNSTNNRVVLAIPTSSSVVAVTTVVASTGNNTDSDFTIVCWSS